MPTPQLLMLYNRRFNAYTIRDHVEHLRKHGFVWWGRFYNGPKRFDAAAARERWPHVAQLAAERALSGEPSLVFATDYQAFHVFKVTRILLGDDPGEGARKEALAGYADKSVPVWFKVEDSRALSYDHDTTNDWFGRLGAVLGGSTRGNGEPFNHPYDPTGAVLNQFPIVVEGPAVDELFGARTLPQGLKRWADAHDAMSSQPVQKALDYLDTYMDQACWKRTSSAAKAQIAEAWVIRGYLARDEDVDPTNASNHVARAFEIELRDEVLEPFERLVAARGLRKIDEAIDEARSTYSGGVRRPWTLGSMVGFLETCVSCHRRELDAMGLGALAKVGVNLAPLKEMVLLRNVTIHAGKGVAFDPRAKARDVLFGFFEGRGKALGPVLDAKDAVRRVAAS